jgi:hypothetical protein
MVHLGGRRPTAEPQVAGATRTADGNLELTHTPLDGFGSGAYAAHVAGASSPSLLTGAINCTPGKMRPYCRRVDV